MIGKNQKGKLVRMNFCGPGTQLQKREGTNASIPINKVDAVCKTHDYAYARIGNSKASASQKKKDVRRADVNMINSLKKYKNWESSVATLAIRGKIAMEKLHLINRLQFID